VGRGFWGFLNSWLGWDDSLTLDESFDDDILRRFRGSIEVLQPSYTLVRIHITTNLALRQDKARQATVSSPDQRRTTPTPHHDHTTQNKHGEIGSSRIKEMFKDQWNTSATVSCPLPGFEMHCNDYLSCEREGWN
jgi:hypothetical protein